MQKVYIKGVPKSMIEVILNDSIGLYLRIVHFLFIYKVYSIVLCME